MTNSLPVSRLTGVGPRLSEHLARCGIQTVQDLLFHLPLRYQDRTRITFIKNLRPNDYAVIEGTIQSSKIIFMKGRRILSCRLQDITGQLTLRFFHFNFSQKQKLAPDTLVRCFGEIRIGKEGFEIIHPEYQIITPETPPLAENSLTPVYPTTEGLSQNTWRKLTEQALFLATIPDYLPAHLLSDLPRLQDALQYVHRPPPDAPVEQLAMGLHPAQQRLALEELLAHQLSLRYLRHKIQHHQAPVLSATQLTQTLQTNLPFTLTTAQQRVWAEITADLAQSIPMLRLLQGDVGSGKTIIAALAALQAIGNHYQTALMAPTELLAEQHLRNFTTWLAPLGIKVISLTGRLTGKARAAILHEIANEPAVVIGTHALFQQDVQFARLGLVIIDEQHRFGVHQRLALQQKGIHPHQLVMTATPIPRTLAMTAYADLDCSVIDELPPGRTPIQTVVISNKRRAEVIQRIQQACREQQQIYWVCPLIEESEILQCQAAETALLQLQQLLPDMRVGLLHGRLTPSQKEAVMAAFKARKLDLLVATTVIEVGVDIPNASVMVIENAERLGLAQLHQLRGRVGRGNQASYCLLLYHPPLANLAKERLEIMRTTNDGFLIAQRDLELRGPGEIMGARQAGMMNLRIADLLRDQHLLPTIHKLAEIIIRQHPEIITPLIQRWLPSNTLVGIA